MSRIVGAKVIVVGGGLAGLSAAHTIAERGGRVLVLDKKEFLGGNSVKATSGINGALTRTQIEKGIKDSPLAFEQDTVMSAIGVKKPDNLPDLPLAKVLTHNSGPDVEWLINHFGLDLSLVSQLGGHSFPRTHRGKERFPGMTITYALMEKYDDLVAKDPTRCELVTLARATKLLTDAAGNVSGVEYEKGGKSFSEYGPVILATGGYGADFEPNSLLAKYRPDLLHLPTTNGDHNTGDGIKMTSAIGGALIDMKAVQVHPTGLVHPNEPDTKVKFLAAEALRGVGGMLLDKNGKRFADELGTREYVTGEMWKAKAGPYRLVLNSKGSNEILWHCKHYVGRGLMKHFKSGKDLAAEMGVSVDTLKSTFEKYNAGAKNKNDEFGKKYFHNMPFDVNDEFHVAIVCPVVHYTMGGVQIAPDASIVKEGGSAPVGGLFAAGEVAGGVHGRNRLGGSGLLGCVVFGRVAGASATKYLLNQLSAQQAQRRLDGVLGQVAPGGRSVTITINWDDASGAGGVSSPAPQSAPASAPAAAPAPAPAKKMQEYTLADVAKHNTEKDCWVVVNGQVLDATTFLDRHPGGKHAILLFAGKDASAEFNMIHKPDVVQKYSPEIIIGTLKA
jgi:flavocytochrome c